MKESNHTIDKKVQKLLALLLGIYQKGVVKEVILGYEPADDDMMILRVARKQIEMLNENVFNSRWACSVYNFAKHMKLSGVRERGLGITTAQLEASAGALTAGAVYRISRSGAGLGTAGFAGRGKWY